MSIIDRPEIANNIHAVTLIGAGLTGYLLNEKRPATALIPPAAGTALLLMSRGVEAGNRNIAHAAAGLTSLLSLMTGSLLVKTLRQDTTAEAAFTAAVRKRRTSLFGLMTLTGLAAVGVYVTGFVQKRRQQAEALS